MKRLNRQNRIALLIIVLLIIGGLLTVARFNLFPFTFQSQQIGLKTPIAVTAVPAANVQKPVKIIRLGSVENANTVPIKTEFPGHLSEIYVTEGQSVKSGQPLFTVEAIATPSGDNEGSTNPTRGSSQQLQANYENALKDFERYQKLYEIGGIPRRQLDNAAARLQDAQRNLANDQIIPSGSSNTEPFTGSSTVNAPIDGIVTGLSGTPGKTVQAEQQLFSLGSGQEVEIVIPIEQQDLYLVHLGDQTTTELSSQIIAGQVSAIYPEIKENQVSAFRACIKLINNPVGLLKPGMSVPVHINTGKSTTVAAVPTAAIFQDTQGRNFVYVAVDGKAIRRQIILGETIGEFTEITSDLPHPSIIITSQITDLKNGDFITITH